MLGRPRTVGLSLIETAWQPLSDRRFISATVASMSHTGSRAAGNEAPRIGAAPFIDVPVIVGAQMGQRLALVLSLSEQAAVDHREAGEVE